MSGKGNVVVPGQSVPASQEQLEAQEKELQKKENLLTQKEAELTLKEATLNKKEEDLNERELQIEKKEHLIAKAEKKSDRKAPRKGLDFSFRGEEYHFVDGAPESFRFEGKVWSQKEIIEDEEALVMLIGGKSSLIEKK